MLISISSYVIDFTADNYSTTTAKASEKVDFAIDMTGLTPRPTVSHRGEQVPFLGQRVEFGRGVEVGYFFMSKKLEMIIGFSRAKNRFTGLCSHQKQKCCRQQNRLKVLFAHLVPAIDTSRRLDGVQKTIFERCQRPQ